MTSGKELQLKRIAMDVPQGALAEKIGVPQPTVSRWENARIVKAKAADRYLAALATFGTIPAVPTPEAAA